MTSWYKNAGEDSSTDVTISSHLTRESDASNQRKANIDITNRLQLEVDRRRKTKREMMIDDDRVRRNDTAHCTLFPKHSQLGWVLGKTVTIKSLQSR